MLAMRRCKGRRVTRDENTNDNNNVCDSLNSVSNSEAYENTNDNNNVSDCVNCVTNSDEPLDLSFSKLEVWTGIVQFNDMSSIIPTVGAVNIPISESPLSDEMRDSESPLPGEIPDSESPLPGEIPDSESPCSVPSCLEGLFDDESVDKLVEGIMLESPSIPTVGAVCYIGSPDSGLKLSDSAVSLSTDSPVTLPQEIRDCGSPGTSIEIACYSGSPDSGLKPSDSAVSLSTDSPVTLPQEIRDCGSPGSSIEIVSEYYNSGDEDELSVLYESYGSHIKVKPYYPMKRLVLSEEINIFDNISQNNHACNSSGQSGRRLNPEFVCIMNPKIKYICHSGAIDTEFENPENLPCVRIMHPIGRPYQTMVIEGITEPCLVSIERYYVKYK